MKIGKDKLVLLLILLTGFVLRIAVSPHYTHTNDMGLWMYWAKAIAENGFQNFFIKVNWTDYLPFYFYFLFILEKITPFVPIDGNLLFKMPAIIADILTTVLIYSLAKKFELKNSNLIAGLYIFNPAIFANSAMWGQVDGLGALIVVAALYFFVNQKEILLGLVIAMAILFKPLYLFLLPIILVAQMRLNFLKLPILILSVLSSIFLLTLPFVSNIIYIPKLIYDRYQASLNQYHYASANAFNFWGMLGKNWVSDDTLFWGITFHNWGLLLFGLIFLMVILNLIFNRSKDLSYLKLITLSLAITFLAIFTFATRAHERHLLTFFPLFVFFVTGGRVFLFFYVLLSTIYLTDLYFALYYLYLNGGYIFSNNIIQLFSTGIVLSCLFLVYKYTFQVKSIIK